MADPIIDLKKSRACSHVGCIGYGRWVPKLVVSLVGQTAVEKPVSLLITILLCDLHKKRFEPESALTTAGKMKFVEAIKRSRGADRKANWDTLNVEWADIDDVARILQ